MPSTQSTKFPLDYNKNNPDLNSWYKYIHEENARIQMSESQRLEAEVQNMNTLLKSAKKVLNLKAI